jgi:uncharacterized protein YndB with AHSA1/START domain
MKIRLARGEVLTSTEPVAGSSVPRAVVRAVIEAPVEAVWRLIEQSSRYAEFMPRIKEAQELSRMGHEVRTRTVFELPFPLKNLTAITRAIHTVEPGVRYVREWKLEEGDYHVNEGTWTLVPLDGDPRRTLAVYRVHIVPKIPVPKSLQTMAQEKTAPKLIEAIRQRVARG